MRAGKLPHRILVQKPTLTQGASGEELNAWADFATLSAEVIPLRGTEAVNANQMLAGLDTKIRIRWSPNNDLITEKWRIVFESIVYEITNVIHVRFGGRMIELMCRSGINNG